MEFAPNVNLLRQLGDFEVTIDPHADADLVTTQLYQEPCYTMELPVAQIAAGAGQAENEPRTYQITDCTTLEGQWIATYSFYFYEQASKWIPTPTLLKYVETTNSNKTRKVRLQQIRLKNGAPEWFAVEQ